MNKIPTDILTLIASIYQQKDFTSIEKADWNLYDEYLKELKELFSGLEISNNTDYNYNHGYEYDIIDKPSNTSVGINISKIIKYYCLAFLGSESGSIYGTPQSALQQEIREKLQAFFISKGYNEISLEQSWEIIPEVETELKEEGEATVRDCIF